MKKYPLYNVAYYKNFRDYLYGIAQINKDKPAVTFYDRKGNETCVSYNRLVHDSFAFALFLQREGLHGKHIAIVGENSYAWLIAYLGTVASASVAVTIDIEQPTETIHNMITKADSEIVIASPAVYSICETLLENGSISRLFLMNQSLLSDPCEELPPEMLTFPDYSDFILPITDDTTAAIVYTSGTTSTSKPVVLTQIGILTNMADGTSLITAGKRLFNSLPFYHTFGLNSSLLAIFLVGPVICINGDLKTLMRDLKAFNPDSLMAVPLLVETLHRMLWIGIEKAGKKKEVKKLVNIVKKLQRLGLPVKSKTLIGIKQQGIGDLPNISCGGAHIELEILEDLRAFGIVVLEGYGITECSPLISVSRNRYYKFSSVGLIAPNYEVKFVDGEIFVKGISVMKGYYNSPEETEKVFEDGWFKTGDLGYMDKKGFLYITGRKKNLIVFKNGKKVSPEEVEAKLSKIDLIKEVVAYGASSGTSTDDVKLAIMVYPDPDLTKGMSSYEILEALQREIDVLNQAFPSYKQIQMINIREGEFSKTASKKIKRQMV